MVYQFCEVGLFATYSFVFDLFKSSAKIGKEELLEYAGTEATTNFLHHTCVGPPRAQLLWLLCEHANLRALARSPFQVKTRTSIILIRAGLVVRQCTPGS